MKKPQGVYWERETHINHDTVRVGEERLQEHPENIVQEAQRQKYTCHLQHRKRFQKFQG